ncbi:PAS domain-containing protein [Sphingobacterium alkalisoli]|uniref:PAS domain-containing protein n=1 Tax=Sphingobacterium alkalisoli TaxID=1874115 RepID=A0A4U0GXC4_9SPHI|nr:LuxR C-terminal-related transcriptional regulator [Sphingobacterium alkalisoli]TJY63708.1 PAS domain-containing protein [Sphingobacterium alkalisoli]GGH25402.1 hypothetical protein GCM10011418_33990 [Sphingobacterium alkalisoli]
MQKLVLDQAQKIWTEIAKNKKPTELQIEVELYKKMLRIFQVGDFCYLVFNPPEMKIEYCSDYIHTLTGYTPEEFTLQKLLDIIHPEDLPYFLDFEATVTDFFKRLPPDKVMKYKTRYDYRIRKSDGEYLRILQQIVTIQSDEDGAVLRTFVVHTDISHLKKDNKMQLSFIGMEGEPSYLNVSTVNNYAKKQQIFTKREQEILVLLSQNKKTKDIAEELCISKSTVSTHRKNMLRKTNTHTVLELVSYALSKGDL